MSAAPSSPSQSPSGESITRKQRLETVWNLLGPLLALLCVVLVFAIADAVFADGTFATWQNLRTVAAEICIVSIAALGMTIIIIAKGIDLSAGTALALCATTFAWGLREDVAYRMVHGANYANASVAFEEAQDDLAQLVQRQQDVAADKSKAKPPTKQELSEARERVAAARKTLKSVFHHKRDQLQAALEAWPPESAQEAREVMESVDRRFAVLDSPDLRPFEYRDEGDDWFSAIPNSPWSTPLALIIGLFTGLFTGLLNGLLITRLRIVPFIVTLGTATIFLGLGNLLAENSRIEPRPAQVPAWIDNLTGASSSDALLFGFPSGVWLMIVLAIAVSLLLRFTVFGRHVFAIGSNEATARLCGINVTATRVAVYSLAGLLLAISGICLFSRLGIGTATTGVGKELSIIAAVTIGGGSLSGGRGTVLGTLTGAFTVAVIESGCQQLGMPDAIRLMVLGCAIIGAAAIDRWRQGGEEE